jgi:glycerol-3-phosphate dehydrogenase (NAD(P)+)
MDKKINITVIGAGSWGTTFSVMLALRGYRIKLWARSRNISDEIKNYRKNQKYTGDLHIPENVIPFTNRENYLKDSEIIIFAVPSHVLREIIISFNSSLKENINSIKCILNLAKGFETVTNLRLSQVMEETIPGKLKSKICVLSGPNIAPEIAMGLPSVSVVASTDKKILKYIQKIISSDSFRVYTNNDIIGVEIGGAVKNIIAIAAGISDGLGYKANTKASLITRGLYELTRFGVRMGADRATFSGAAGMGDLVATCISEKSRNRNTGERIAKGEKINDILKNMYMVAEGVNTTKAVYDISRRLGIEVPITECIYEIIYKGLNPLESVKKLMTRKFKSEIEEID